MRTDPAHAALIVESLEIAGAQRGDLSGAVYALLFARQPQLQPLFWRDSDGAIKGEMLARAFDAILDFVGERHYGHHLIQTEVVNHDVFDVPRDVFASFFGIVCEVVREACGPDWSEATALAWAAMLVELDGYIVAPASVAP